MNTITTIGERRERYAMDSELANWALTNHCCEQVQWALFVMFGIIEDGSCIREGSFEAMKAHKILADTLGTEEDVEVMVLEGAETIASLAA